MQYETFKKAREFIYRNARPIDLAMWRYHFESGSADDVYTALSAYQNSDGGFAYGIEPDFLNVNSTPIATWCAIRHLREIGIDGKCAIVNGILKYLDSGKDFSNGKWHNTVPTNNDFPHAIWWHCRDGVGKPDDNPTVSLAGFALRYGDRQSALYGRCADIVKNCITRFIEDPTDEMHILYCYLELFEYCVQINGFDLIDMEAFRAALFAAVKKSVCADSSKWFTEYVCKPSMFFDSSKLLFDIVGRELCAKEGRMLVDVQLPDGTWPVTWLWHNDYTEFYVSKNMWKSNIIRQNMLYLRALGILEL